MRRAASTATIIQAIFGRLGRDAGVADLREVVWQDGQASVGRTSVAASGRRATRHFNISQVCENFCV